MSGKKRGGPTAAKLVAPKAKTTVAVKVIDMLGEEVVEAFEV